MSGHYISDEVGYTVAKKGRSGVVTGIKKNALTFRDGCGMLLAR